MIRFFKLITGISFIKIYRSIIQLPWYYRTARQFKRLIKDKKEFPLKKNYPCLLDKYDQGGVAQGIYFSQDLYVAQQIFKNNPEKHLDIGSRIDGFVAHVASFRPIEVMDIRAIDSKVKNIIFVQQDLTAISKEFCDYCDSISSLHVIEHFGLGRYGDQIDPEGHIKGIQNLVQILKTGGICYLSVPIGEQRIEFNAHRVFGLQYLLNLLKIYFQLISFSYVDDAGNIHAEIELNEVLISNNCGCHYGCGIFTLKKK